MINLLLEVCPFLLLLYSNSYTIVKSQLLPYYHCQAEVTDTILLFAYVSANQCQGSTK